MRRIVWTAAACAAASLMTAVPAAGSEPLTEVSRFEGQGCVETGVVVPLPAERLRAFLPAGYEPVSTLGAPGLGEINVAIADCPSFTVDGAPRGRAAISDVGILVASPDRSAGGHYYELWQLTTDEAHRAGMEGAGVAGGLVDGLRADATPGPVRQGSADASWPAGGYTVQVTAAAPFSPGASNQWWHEGPRGRARIAFSFPRIEMLLGTGRVTAEPGSPLARILGRETALGVGYVVDLDFDAVVSASSPPAGATDAADLRLRAEPARTTAGRRTRFRFQVSQGDEPAPGALVRLGRRAARTDGAGVARLTAVLRRPGLHRARARLGSRVATRRIRAVMGERMRTR
jgi:hypothetical protein